MILLVPISPEVPKFHKPTWGPSWGLIAFLAFCYLWFLPVIKADQAYIDQFQALKNSGALATEQSERDYLRQRPLLTLSIAPASWSVDRALFSNFLHGGLFHLFLNLVGLAAGVRICTTFMPFLCTFSIFFIGGGLGLLFSVLLNTQPSGDFVPHLGSSAGLFALMGTYYIYNFRFRTTYFFWLPGRQGRIALRTSWFFFVDVLLLELLLSTGQFLPETFDGVDHLAHVGGFAAGCGLALILRTAQRWPSMLQTRGEFLYWSTFLGDKLKKSQLSPALTAFSGWIELLKINFFNDQLKLKLVQHLSANIKEFPQDYLDQAFHYFSPTFSRLHSNALAELIESIRKAEKEVPRKWLRKAPYDIVIQISKSLAKNEEGPEAVFFLVSAFDQAQPNEKTNRKKVRILVAQVKQLREQTPKASGE